MKLEAENLGDGVKQVLIDKLSELARVKLQLDPHRAGSGHEGLGHEAPSGQAEASAQQESSLNCSQESDFDALCQCSEEASILPEGSLTLDTCWSDTWEDEDESQDMECATLPCQHAGEFPSHPHTPSLPPTPQRGKLTDISIEDFKWD